MKQILLAAILCLIFLSCNDNRKTYDGDSAQKETHQLKETLSLDKSEKKSRKSLGKPVKKENSGEIVSYAENSDSKETADDKEPQHSKTPQQTSDQSITHFEKKLIKNATMRIEVADYYKTRLRILALAGNFHGYIAAENEVTSNGTIENQMVIRATGKEFDSIIENIAGMAKKIEHKDIKADDVTAAYYDLETRLKTEREVQKRYLEMLSHAKKIDEMMEVQEKIDEITEEIESKEGQIRVMNDQATYSTLNLEFYQELPFKPTAATNNGPGFFYKTGIALSNGWHGLLSLIVALFNIWPLFLVILMALFTWRWIKMRRLVK
jgi:hypothetical protein